MLGCPSSRTSPSGGDRVYRENNAHTNRVLCRNLQMGCAERAGVPEIVSAPPSASQRLPASPCRPLWERSFASRDLLTELARSGFTNSKSENLELQKIVIGILKFDSILNFESGNFLFFTCFKKNGLLNFGIRKNQITDFLGLGNLDFDF